MTSPSKRRHFDENFKKRAVRMLLDSGKPVSSFAASIGVERSSLQRWRVRYKEECLAAAGKSPRNDGTVGVEDFIRLQREVASMRETVDQLRSIVRRSLVNRYRNEIGLGSRM